MKTPLIDREIFFGDPEISAARLSPDGKWLSFVKPFQGVRNIWVKRFKQSFQKARPLTNDQARPITSYFWTRNSKWILYVQDQHGDENYTVFAVNPRVKSKDEIIPEAKALTKLQHVRVNIYAVGKINPNIIYLGLNDRDPAWHDLYSLNIATGKLKRLRLNKKRVVEWIFDRNDQLRIAVRANEDGSSDFLRLDGNAYEVIYSVDVLESAQFLRFHEDGDAIYLETNKGKDRNLSQLILLNLRTCEEEFIEKDPEQNVDFSGAIFAEKDNRILATFYTDEQLRIYWRDQSFREDFQFLQNKFPGKEVMISSMTLDETKCLVYMTSDVDCGSVYSFDRVSKALKLQYRLRPLLNPKLLSNMTPIHYPSSDGLMIPGYLTLPKGLKHRKLPLVVHPHGGPWVRDTWGYHSVAQFLANRGYAVLQMNFRGSTGYGKNFLDAGNKEWGAKMQDDITWGIRFLVEQGWVDPKRVGIMGGSYGGYAALAAAAFTPEVYACAISKVGPSSLITLLESIPPYWEAGRKMFHVRMGDPTTLEGKQMLMERSPLYAVDRIRCPMMIVQGANDPRVKKSESDQIVDALRKVGKEVNYLCAPDEGHGFAHPVNNMAFMASAEQFLAKHLGGRFQESMPATVQEKLNQMLS